VVRTYFLSMLTLLIILLVLSAAFGGWGHTRRYGYRGWSPLGIVVVILLVLWATGNLAGGHPGFR
jgi:hypothetical protein